METYKGTITTTGSSEAIRIDKHLFKSHPEFEQKAGVVAKVIGRGVLLVYLEGEARQDFEDDDPVVRAFLAFLEHDIQSHPASISAITNEEIETLRDLTSGVVVSDDETLPEDAL